MKYMIMVVLLLSVPQTHAGEEANNGAAPVSTDPSEFTCVEFPDEEAEQQAKKDRLKAQASLNGFMLIPKGSKFSYKNESECDGVVLNNVNKTK